MILQLEARIQITEEDFEEIKNELAIIYPTYEQEEIIEFLKPFVGEGNSYPKSDFRNAYKNYFYKTTIHELETPYLYELKTLFQGKVK